MFIEKLKKQDYIDFLKSIGYEIKEGNSIIEYKKADEPFALVSCKMDAFTKKMNECILNFTGMGRLFDKQAYDLGKTFVFYDFVCFDYAHQDDCYNEQWCSFLSDKFPEYNSAYINIYKAYLKQAAEKSDSKKNNDGQTLDK